MAYKHGDAKIMTEAALKEEWRWEPGDNPVSLSDSRGDDRDPPVVYLPHSCDRWIIGGAAEVQVMLADLMTILAELEDRNGND